MPDTPVKPPEDALSKRLNALGESLRRQVPGEPPPALTRAIAKRRTLFSGRSRRRWPMIGLAACVALAGAVLALTLTGRPLPGNRGQTPQWATAPTMSPSGTVSALADIPLPPAPSITVSDPDRVFDSRNARRLNDIMAIGRSAQ